MTSLSYKSWLAPMVVDRSKPHTIRAARKNPFRPGQLLQHFTGMRTTACKRLGESVCLNVWPIEIYPEAGEFALPDEALSTLHIHYLLQHRLYTSDLARADGFASSQAFFDFFKPEAVDGTFKGDLIFWGDTFEPASRGHASAQGIGILRNMLGMAIADRAAPKYDWGRRNILTVDKAHISPAMEGLIVHGHVRQGLLRSQTCRVYHATIAGMREAGLPQALIPRALEIGRAVL